MKIEREISGDVAILTMRGEFDSFVVSSYLEEIESLAANGIRNIVLDMRAVKFIMSTAIGAIVKSRKMMKEIGGDLVIAQPSSFVGDVLESLGLTRVIRVFADNDRAVESMGQSAVGDLPAGNCVLLHFQDEAAAKKSGPIVGRINDLNEEGMAVQVESSADLFPAETDLKAKFRLPLFKKAYYFEIPCRVVESKQTGEGAGVKIHFQTMEDQDRESIRQFIADMQFLREEVKNAGKD